MTATPGETRPTDPLRTRIKRLAADPRARIMPELRGLAFEMLHVLDEVDRIGLDLASLRLRRPVVLFDPMERDCE